MFLNCTSLKTLNLSGLDTRKVTDMGGIFAYCSSLTDVVIPESVTSIGSGAFYGCEKLVSIALPASVKSVGQNAFYG